MDKENNKSIYGLPGIVGQGKQKIDINKIILIGAGNLELESIKEGPKILFMGDHSSNLRLVEMMLKKTDLPMIIASPYNSRNETSGQNYIQKSLIDRLGPRPYTENISKLFDKINLELANLPYQKSEMESILGSTSVKMIGVISSRPYIGDLDLSDEKIYFPAMQEETLMYSDLDNTRDYMKKYNARKTFDKRNMIKRR